MRHYGRQGPDPNSDHEWGWGWAAIWYPARGSVTHHVSLVITYPCGLITYLDSIVIVWLTEIGGFEKNQPRKAKNP